jgi:hypothetical protein
MLYRFICLFSFLLVFMGNKSDGIIITNFNQSYTQNFDSFGVNDLIWANLSSTNSPINWFAFQSSGGSVTNLVANSGDVAVLGMINFGSQGAIDRALGSFSGSTRSLEYGVGFWNQSHFQITNVFISYTGEQWRRGLNNQLPAKLAFYYETTETTNWIAVSNLDFEALHADNIAMALDGNDNANQTSLQWNIPVLLSPSERFTIRWVDENMVNSDHGLAIDNVTVTMGSSSSFIPITNTTDFEVVLRKPKSNKPLSFRKDKGFKVKCKVINYRFTPVTQVSYLAFSGTNFPTNASFIPLKKKRNLQSGTISLISILYGTKGRANRAGIGMEVGSSLITLVIKVDGTKAIDLPNGTFTNILTFSTNFVFEGAQVR